VEVADLPIVGHEAVGGVIEGIFVVEDMLLQVMDMILIGLLGNGGIDLAICNGLE
jgi:hypothetical protein